jgi:hypothetical protein
MKRIFGPKRDEVIGGWRKLHNEKLHNSCSSQSTIRMVKSRRLKREGHVARMETKKNAYRILVGKPERKRPLGRPRRRYEDNIKRDKMGWYGLIKLRTGTSEHGNEPSSSIKFWEFFK